MSKVISVLDTPTGIKYSTQVSKPVNHTLTINKLVYVCTGNVEINTVSIAISGVKVSVKIQKDPAPQLKVKKL